MVSIQSEKTLLTTSRRCKRDPLCLVPLISHEWWGSHLAVRSTLHCLFLCSLHLRKHNPSSLLSLISVHQECKHQSWWRTSHEAAPSPSRAEDCGEAAQLLWHRQRAYQRLWIPSSVVQLGFTSQHTTHFASFLQPRGEFCFISKHVRL